MKQGTEWSRTLDRVMALPTGPLAYTVIGQDGVKTEMHCPDTPENRRFVAWMYVHDRGGAA